MIHFHNIDCMEFMHGQIDKAFDLAIVDPPYGIKEDGHRSRTGKSTLKWKNYKSKIYHIFDDSKPPSQEYFQELFRISKNQIIWGGNYFQLPISSGWIVWDKKAGDNEPLSQCELAWTSFSCKLRKFTFLWAGFKKEIQEERIHPTQKPVSLYRWIFQNYWKPGWKVIDTHGGSMSIAIAAHDAGADLDICEIDKDYFVAGKNRLEEYQMQGQFDFTGGK